MSFTTNSGELDHQGYSYPPSTAGGPVVRHSSGIPISPQQQQGGGVGGAQRYPSYPTHGSVLTTSQMNVHNHHQQQQQMQHESVPDPTQNSQFFVGTYEQSSPHPMQRRASSSRSIGGASAASSSSKIGQSVLHDATFAPPPKHPGVGSNYEVVKAQYFGEGKEVASTPPDYASITHSGTVLARISARTMLTKKWKHSFWITYGVTKVLFFRSKNDFEDWLMNPYVTNEERAAYVKLQIDFSNDCYRAGVKGYKVTPVQLKDYGKNGMMYQFKLERWLSTGPSIAAAFAGVNENDVKSLFKLLQEMVQNSPQRIQDYESDASSFYDSDAGGGYYSDGSKVTDYSQTSKRSSSGRSWKSSKSDRSLQSNKSGVEIAMQLMDSMRVGRKNSSVGSMDAQNQEQIQNSYGGEPKKSILPKFGRKNKDNHQPNPNDPYYYNDGPAYSMRSTGSQNADGAPKKGLLSRFGRQNTEKNDGNYNHDQGMGPGPGGEYYQYS